MSEFIGPLDPSDRIGNLRRGDALKNVLKATAREFSDASTIAIIAEAVRAGRGHIGKVLASLDGQDTPIVVDAMGGSLCFLVLEKIHSAFDNLRKMLHNQPLDATDKVRRSKREAIRAFMEQRWDTDTAAPKTEEVE